jgi:hypothetical protein
MQLPALMAQMCGLSASSPDSPKHNDECVVSTVPPKMLASCQQSPGNVGLERHLAIILGIKGTPISSMMSGKYLTRAQHLPGVQLSFAQYEA